MARRGAVLAALTAAGVDAAPSGLLTTYEMSNEASPSERRFVEAALAAGHTEATSASWPCDAEVADVGEVLYRTDDGGVFRLPDGTVVRLSSSHGWMMMWVAAGARDRAADARAAFQAQYPPLYRADADDGTVPVTFWTYGRFGPQSRLRMIEAAPWADVERNYAGAVRGELARLSSPDFEPGRDGQLLLWQGPPGTGKTWALRALVAEWSSWAEFNYITDPDAFFVDSPDYMIDVLLHDSYEELVVGTGDVVTSADPGGKWRVLILEDTGELLAADAKAKAGQGLSRLLNVVDGMIGQGLRILVLVTTNDELGDLHPAAVRPGRCASQLVFGPLSADEATEWLGAPVDAPATLAELYERRGGGVTAGGDLIPIPGADGWFVPAAALDRALGMVRNAVAEDVRAEVARVAAERQPDAEGYGDTAFHVETATVLYVAGDWTDVDAVAADFLAIDGVDAFVSEAEALPAGWCEAVSCYPDPPTGWTVSACDDGEAALRAALELARTPLTVTLDEPVAAAADPLAADVAALVESVEQKPDPEAASALASALQAIADAHRRTVDGVAAVVASAAQQRDTGRGDHLAELALGVLDRFASRPAPAPAAAPDVHVHIPKHDMNVRVDAPTFAPQIDVHVPEQPPAPAPVVHVAAAEAPVVNMTVAAPEQVPATVEVHVPAPHVDVHVAAPPSRAIRVEEDPVTGERRYVPEEIEEER